MTLKTQGALDPGPPLATADQEWVERTAAKLREHPQVQAAIERVKEHWASAMAPNAEHLSRYDAEYEQAAFCGLMNTANDDPFHPRLHAFGRLAHRLDDYTIPATKSGHPNPDYIYRFAPINGQSHYVLHGQLPKNPPTAFEVAMLTAEQAYQKNVSLADLNIDEMGRFSILIDPMPSEGRPNHFLSDSDTFQLLIRDVIADPANQLPIALQLERIGPAPAHGTVSFEAMIANAERHIRKHVDDLVFVTGNFIQRHPANQFARPEIKQGSMWSVAQAYSSGNFSLADDQALLINLSLGNAKYAVVPISDFWGGIGQFLDTPSCLGTGQAVANPDGSYTFVVAHRDPGIANWVATDGLHKGAMFIRWIGFSSPEDGTSPPDLSVELVALTELDSRIPEQTPRLSRAERTARRDQWRSHYCRVMG